MTTMARKQENGYWIKGTKHFISNAGEADFIVVYAKTDVSAGSRGISAFVIETANGGVEVGAAERTMGLKGGHIFEMAIDCLVPTQNLLGPEGTGMRTALKALDAGRLDICAVSIGIAEAAMSAAVAWAKARKLGGVPLAEFQGVQWMLADMKTDIAAGRALGVLAATKRAAGQRYSLEASMAKLFASEAACRVTDKALQIHGGYGYSSALPLERYVRDVRLMRIGEGSSEIQRNIIARHVLA
jgi:alkylation response protein AidB-like acyl-CoA dehydrogenase